METAEAQWRFLQEKFHWNSVYNRFGSQRGTGVWDQTHEHFLYDPDMEHLFLDTIIRAHAYAAGVKKS